MTQCPACQAALPVPAERFCANCGYDLQAGRAPGLPPPPPPFNPGGGGGWGTPPRAGRGTPWERRAEIGATTALVDTTLAVLLRPIDLFREMSTTGGLWAPLLYGTILGYAGVLVMALYDLVFNAGGLGMAVADWAKDPRLAPFSAMFQGAGGLLSFATSVLLGIPYVLIRMFVMAGLTHLCLMLLGGASRGFEATFRAAAYSEAASVLAVLPFCGCFVVPLYRLVVMVIGVKEAQQIAYGKAIVGVLLPLVLVCCCCVVIPGLLFGTMIAAAVSQMLATPR
jgi:hypothetical protein